MTDRVRSLTIALEEDIRDDDIEPLIKAIEQFRGVLKVDKNITTPNDWSTEMRVKNECVERLYKLMKEFRG